MLIFKPSLSIIYSFFAGILVSLAANLFTGARLQQQLALPTEIAYFSALFFLLSSASLFSITWRLEGIRNAVTRRMGTAKDKGFPDHLEADYLETELRKGRPWIISSFAVSVLLIIYSVILMSTGRWWPFC